MCERVSSDGINMAIKTLPYKNSSGEEPDGLYHIAEISHSTEDQLDWTSKITDRGRMRELGEELRSAGKAISFTAGTFDMIHVGHARFLAVARSLGDVLVVGINTDRSVKAYKGDDRPILNQERRGEMLAHLMAVDHVVIFDEDFPDEVIKELRPHKFLCIEERWEGKLDERPDVKIVLGLGGEVYCSPRQDPELSTTQIIKKLMKDGQRELLKELSVQLNQDGSLKGSL